MQGYLGAAPSYSSRTSARSYGEQRIVPLPPLRLHRTIGLRNQGSEQHITSALRGGVMRTNQRTKRDSLIRSMASYVNPGTHLTIQRATEGDPKALRELFGDLAAFLRGDKELQYACASFFIDALEKLVERKEEKHAEQKEEKHAEQKDLWTDAASEFERRTSKDVPFEYEITKRGPRVSEATRRKLGSAFCRAFNLSKPRGRNVNQYQFRLMPDAVWTIAILREHGASLDRARRIVRSAIRLDLSDRQIKEWFLRASWLKMPQAGTWRFRCGPHRRRLRVATHVLHRTARGMEPAEAYREVARVAVTEICFLRTASVYLLPETVKEAYEYITTCGDPTWSRVERFVKHTVASGRRTD